MPTAPIPVQTAYAVPIGRSCTAFASSTMLDDEYHVVAFRRDTKYEPGVDVAQPE